MKAKILLLVNKKKPTWIHLERSLYRLIQVLKTSLNVLSSGVFPMIIILLFSLFLLTGCSSDPPISRSNDLDNVSYNNSERQISKSNEGTLNVNTSAAKDIIHPGDQIQIMVWGYPEFNTTTTVKEFGTVTIPLVGEVMAAGLSKDEFSKSVKERLSEYVKGDPQITISHIAMNERVSVMGAVNKQDNYPILSQEPLVEIIAAAGGPSTDADMQHVKIFRKGSYNNVEEVDLTRYLQNGDMQSVPNVKPGDVVFIPKEENIMRDVSHYAEDVLLLFGFFRILY